MLKDYGELISAIVAIILLVFAFAKMWSFFTRLGRVETDITEMKLTEATNHRVNLDRIEEMRKERHDEIVQLKAEIAESNRENRSENKEEHTKIQETLKKLGDALIEVVTEIRVTKGIRIKNGGSKKPVKA